MRIELEKKLQNEFPFMLDKSKNEAHSDYERYGCRCDDGWYSLIRNLCIDITSAYQAKGLEIDLSPIQIKEKFGALYFHFEIIGQSEMSKEIMALAEKYKDRSKYICESCGSEGELKTIQSYVKTLCDSCYQNRMEKRL